ncbi:hypothetical protein NMY22_g2959 [Coprinellus aureogranulatus]|nr:hypothetical protein NMY22_g2959 [Coprinellus aureogranulatus]
MVPSKQQQQSFQVEVPAHQRTAFSSNGGWEATDFRQLCFCGAPYSKHLLLSSSTPDGLTPGGSNLFVLFKSADEPPPLTQTLPNA